MTGKDNKNLMIVTLVITRIILNEGEPFRDYIYCTLVKQKQQSKIVLESKFF